MFEVDFQMEGLMRTLAECQRRGLDLEPPLKQFGREKRKQITALIAARQSGSTIHQDRRHPQELPAAARARKGTH